MNTKKYQEMIRYTYGGVALTDAGFDAIVQKNMKALIKLSNIEAILKEEDGQCFS